MNELNIQPIDLSHEHRQGVQLPLNLPLVIVGAPGLYELLELGQLYALRLVRHGFLGRPPHRHDTSAKIGQVPLLED